MIHLYLYQTSIIMAILRSLRNFRSTQSGVSGNFDADLFIPTSGRTVGLSSNARLTITLKLFLRQKNDGTGRDALASPYTYGTWPAAEWEIFKNRFRDSVELWDNRYYLSLSSRRANTTQYQAVEAELAVFQTAPSRVVAGRTLQQKFVYRRNFKCSFELVITDNAGDAHQTIDCLYIVDGDNNPITDRGIHRSDSVTVDVGDTFNDPSGRNSIAHEVGHMLGLAHIGVVTEYAPCVAVLETADGSNSSVCYSGETNTFTNNIMGRGGNLINWRQTLPWRTALQRMTGIPMDHFYVHTAPRSPLSGVTPELITEGTPRWRFFFGTLFEWVEIIVSTGRRMAEDGWGASM
jgi:hypothetical protein